MKRRKMTGKYFTMTEIATLAAAAGMAGAQRASKKVIREVTASGAACEGVKLAIRYCESKREKARMDTSTLPRLLPYLLTNLATEPEVKVEQKRGRGRK